MRTHLPALLSPQLVEAIVLPMTHKEAFENIGIQPPKGAKITHLLIIIFNKKIFYYFQVYYYMGFQVLERLYWPEPVLLKQMYPLAQTIMNFIRSYYFFFHL